jgi:hypothetical protein
LRLLPNFFQSANRDINATLTGDRYQTRLGGVREVLMAPARPGQSPTILF